MLHRWFRYCLYSLALCQGLSVHATYYFAMTNQHTASVSVQWQRSVNGGTSWTVLGSGSAPAGGSTVASQGGPFSTSTLDGIIRGVCTTNNFAGPNWLAQRAGGATTVSPFNNTNTSTNWDWWGSIAPPAWLDEPPPAPDLCAELRIQNLRTVPIYFDVYQTQDDTVPPFTSTFSGSDSLEPGTELVLQLGPVENGSEYNVFMIYRLAVNGPEHYEQLVTKAQWTTNCSVPPVTTNTVKPKITFPGDGVTSSNTVGGLQFAGNSGTDANGVQEGTAKQGFGAVYTAIQDNSEAQRDADAVNTSNIVAAITGLGSGTNITIATNIAPSEESMGSVVNPYSSYSMGDGPVGWGDASGFGSGHGVQWTVNLGPLTGDLNLNPLSNAEIAPIATVSRNVFIWVSGVCLIGFAVKRFSETVAASGAMTQASGPNVSVLGTGGNFLSAIIAVGLILAILAAIPAAWLSFRGGNSTVFALLGVDPLSYFPNTAGAMAVGLAFFPMDVILAHAAIGLTFSIGLTVTMWIASVAIRIIPR